MRPKRVLLISLLTTTVLLAACGEEDPTPTPSQSTEDGSAYPVTVEGPLGEVTLEARPERIVSLSPTATEMLFAIGAGDQVVAVDDQSTYPEEAPRTDLSGFTPNAEAVAGYEPDLVVISGDANNLVASLEQLQIPVYQAPAAMVLEDTYLQIEQLGELTGHPEEATDLIEQMRADIDELVAGIPEWDEAPTYYHELDPTFYSVTSNTFLGELYGLFGLENIADAASEGDADNGGYPQLSAEYIIEADPDLIFLADTVCCQQTAETVAARPGWDGISAVQNGNVVELNDDIASRWGPRVVDLLEVIADAVIAAAA